MICGNPDFNVNKVEDVKPLTLGTAEITLQCFREKKRSQTPGRTT